MDAPREDLIRMTRSIRSQDDGNTLVGYAAVFNTWTTIDSWEGTFLERLDPKAFNKTLADRADEVRVLFNHGMDPSIGDKPLGKPSMMKPDRKGLAVEVPLDDTSYNKDLKALLRSGALDGMSFRMSVVGEQWNLPDDPSDYNPDKLPERTITQLRLYEFGPVTFPAYTATTAGVRAHGMKAFRAWEQANGQKPIIPTRAAGDTAADPDEDVGKLAQALDAILDAIQDQLVDVDVTSLPAEVQQAIALIPGAETTVDELLEMLQLPDPDDMDEPDAPRSTQPPAVPEPSIEGHSIRYQPARRQPKSPERRYADREFLKAISAGISSRSTQ